MSVISRILNCRKCIGYILVATVIYAASVPAFAQSIESRILELELEGKTQKLTLIQRVEALEQALQELRTDLSNTKGDIELLRKRTDDGFDGASEARRLMLQAADNNSQARHNQQQLQLNEVNTKAHSARETANDALALANKNKTEINSLVSQIEELSAQAEANATEIAALKNEPTKELVFYSYNLHIDAGGNVICPVNNLGPNRTNQQVAAQQCRNTNPHSGPVRGHSDGLIVHCSDRSALLICVR